jgi:Lrp/AsnC family transcriptional regulator, leucine-responsive regulatory protein
MNENDFIDYIGSNQFIFKKLNLDEKDNQILSLISKNQNLSQVEIADHIHLSQPSVGARIRRLYEKGILARNFGINFKIADISLAKIDVSCSDRDALLVELRESPFFINALLTSGTFNLCIFLPVADYREMDLVVDQYVRKNSFVKKMEANLVISTDKDFIMPMNFIRPIDISVNREKILQIESMT